MQPIIAVDHASAHRTIGAIAYWWSTDSAIHRSVDPPSTGVAGACQPASSTATTPDASTPLEIPGQESTELIPGSIQKVYRTGPPNPYFTCIAPGRPRLYFHLDRTGPDGPYFTHMAALERDLLKFIKARVAAPTPSKLHVATGDGPLEATIRACGPRLWERDEDTHHSSARGVPVLRNPRAGTRPAHDSRRTN
jgi:hypothetical protein